MTRVLLPTGLASHLPLPPQRTASIRMICLRMSTHTAPLFVIPMPVLANSPVPRFSGSTSKGSAFFRSDLSPGTWHFVRFQSLSPSTHGPKVYLVSTNKSLKIRSSRRRVPATNSSSNFLSTRAVPVSRFLGVSRRTRLFSKPSRKSSSMWRLL
jgi:hypothetical protein